MTILVYIIINLKKSKYDDLNKKIFKIKQIFLFVIFELNFF